MNLDLARHLLRARDLAHARYREPLDVAALARAAHVSPTHFTRSFRAPSERSEVGGRRRTST